MNKKLFQLEYSLQNTQKDIKLGLTEVGNSMIRKFKFNEKNKAINSLRDIIGINITQQPPGDIAYGNLASEHPWLPLIQLKNLMPSYSKNLDQNSDSKLKFIHQFLLQKCLNQTSGAQQFIQIQENQNFTYLFQSIMIVLCKVKDEWVNQIAGKIFNVHGQEGLPIYDLNKVKSFYSFLFKSLSDIQQVQSPRLGLMCSESAKRVNQFKSVPQEQFLYFRLTARLFDTLILVNVGKYLPEINLTDFYKKDLTIGSLLLYIMERLKINDSNKFKKRKNELKSQLKLINRSEDFIKRSVSETIVDKVFKEYEQLDKDKIWNYLIWRYYFLFEKQINFDESLQDQINGNEQNDRRKSFIKSNISAESTAEIFMEATLIKIRTMLLFNPQSFSGNDISLNKSISQQDSNSSVEVEIKHLNELVIIEDQ